MISNDGTASDGGATGSNGMTGSEKLTEREEVEALLPWYVTGKLGQADADRVAAYLAAHVDMARQVALIEEERASAEAAYCALPGPKPDALERFMQSVERAQPREQAVRRPPPWRTAPSGIVGAVAGFFAAPSPGAVRWAATAAAVALAVQFAVIATLAVGPWPKNAVEKGRGYHTASGRENGAEGGAIFLVTFARGAVAPAITRFLVELDARIVDGPKPGGAYTVVVPGKAEEAKALLKRISERKDIVELVLPSGS